MLYVVHDSSEDVFEKIRPNFTYFIQLNSLFLLQYGHFLLCSHTNAEQRRS